MTLTIQDLGAIGELLGSVAVLVTLVYLAFQTRQNTQAIGAQLDAATTATTQANLMSVATSDALVEGLREDWTADGTTNELRLTFYFVSMFASFQWQFQQARRGLLPSYNEAQMGAVAGYYFIMFRSFEGWWERNRASYRSEFVEWVEEQRAKAA